MRGYFQSLPQGTKLGSRRPNLQRRVFWQCVGILTAVTVLYSVAVAFVVVQHASLSVALQPHDPLARDVVAICWLLAMPAIALIGRLESRWIIRHVQAPIVSMIERCRELQGGRAARQLAQDGRTDKLGNLALAIDELLSDLHEIIASQHSFLADAAHELRTPLTAQAVVGENVLAKRATLAELREAVGSMLEESKHMRRLADGLLELTRARLIQVGTRAGQPLGELVELSELVQRCVQALQILAEERSQNISVSVGGPLCVNADPTLIRQALLNVLHNAIEHCPEGARIRIETMQSRQQKGLIRVIDNGPGIPLKDQARVFERFYRGSGTSRRRGLGLGLSIAKAVLRSQGGEIQLQSVPGQGCCFTLVLPLIPAAHTTFGESVASSAAPSGSQYLSTSSGARAFRR
jgi:signal transduction histidine kinase